MLSIKQSFPCIWFDNKAFEAAQFYCSIFPNSNIVSRNHLVTMWELYGQTFMGLDGGPIFKPNPSISFFVTCDSHEEVDEIWQKLSEDAMIMMPLDTYEWSDYYGFLEDKFGVSWQIFKGEYQEVNQKIVPCFLFTDKSFGMANEAIHFYMRVFPNSKSNGILFYNEHEMEQKEIVKHAQFLLNHDVFMAMDGAGNHNFAFNEAISFVINCDNQEQIDYFWNAFTKDGGEEGKCGWCKDKFGVSWQVVPAILSELMEDPFKRDSVVQAFMQMNKFEIDKLLMA